MMILLSHLILHSYICSASMVFLNSRPVFFTYKHSNGSSFPSISICSQRLYNNYPPVCLDGSPLGYVMDFGVGEGASNWMVFLEGGGWCFSIGDCYQRSKTNLGTSKLWNTTVTFPGILSNDEKKNPYFYNWNRVLIKYCDGSSFLGDVDEPYRGQDGSIYFRGARVFNAVIDVLLAKGLKDAKNVLFGGCSAGGLSAMLKCDAFRSLLPPTTKVKCVSDAGYIIDGSDIYGGRYVREVLARVIQLHGSAKNLPESCKAKMIASLCMFPQYFAPQIQTPLFIIQSAFDYWQIPNIVAPNMNDKNPVHEDLFKKFFCCRFDIRNCTCDQVKAWRTFGREFHQALSQMNSSSGYGMFVTACGAHCLTIDTTLWLGDKPMIDNVRIVDALGQWYRDDVIIRKVDKHKNTVICELTNYTWNGGPMLNSSFIPLCPAEVSNDVVDPRAAEL